MKRKYVILREDGRPAGGPRARGLEGAPAGTSVPRLEVSDLDARRAVIEAHAPGVRVVAPVVPLRLIEPVPAPPGVATPASAGVTWGVRAVGADTSPFNGAGVVVAVLDTGIDPTHPAFAGVQLQRRNFTAGADDDENGHGTHCAGTIFGREVNGTRIGVAPGVTRALIAKVLGRGGGGSDQLAEAINWAVSNGAHVISMSLGIDFPGYVRELQGQGLPPELATSVALEGYRTNVLLFERLASFINARAAFQQPAVIVAAAGNESRRDMNPDFEIGVSPPAVADGVVSVAALFSGAAGLGVAPFSNTGARVAGPGVGVESARPGGGLVSMNGTSMATPHVAGVAALWAQKLAATHALRGTQLSERLIGSATTSRMGPGFDPADIGAGLAQAPQN